MKITEILSENPKDTKQRDEQRNFVAKHSRNKSGAGVHEDKQGKRASRARQKREWKKETQI